MIRGLYKAATDPKVRKEWRWHALLKIRNWLMPSYRLQWPYMAWWNDADFNAYLERFGLGSSLDADRRWALLQLTKLAARVPGDSAECGVFTGSSSYLICRSLNRRHFMFDSFEGNSSPGPYDGDYNQPQGHLCPLEKTKSNLAGCPNLSFHPGWIPARFNDVAERRFCFVHIDVLQYQPTRDSIEFFYPRMNPGGVIVCDDYGFTICPGARKAVDEFLANKPEKMLELPCGSAFLVRH